jgi:hypothetical protein
MRYVADKKSFRPPKMATDFTTSYAQTAGAMVCLYADVGTAVAESSGFIARVQDRNYIITAAHAILLDRSVWGMENILLYDDGSKGCDAWKNSGQLSLPKGVQNLVFRYVGANDLTKGVFLDNVSLKDSTGVIFKDSFSGDGTFGSQWANEMGVPWTIVKYKGRALTAAARSGDLASGTDDISTLVLKVTTSETTTLKFDYKLDCGGGALVVGYCTSNHCGRLSPNIQGYYGQRVHPLRVVGLDGKGDIAMLLPADDSTLDDFTGLTILANNKTVPIASPIAVIGNPLGIDSQSIATGVLRDNNYVLATAQVVESILTSIADFPGNSGSPYVLLDGTVVGINTYGLASDAGGESTLNGGPGAMLLSRVLNTLAGQITEDQVAEYQKAYLGLQLVGVDINVMTQLGLPMKGSTPLFPPGGFVVIAVEGDSPLSEQVHQLDVILTLEQSGQPSTRRKLGVFQGQSNPSEVTWYMPATGQVDIELLRFDLVQGVWALVQLANVTLAPFPVTRDVPLGPSMSYKPNNSAPRPYAKVAHRHANGKVVQRQYSLSKAI